MTKKNTFMGLKLRNRATAKLLRGDLNADYSVTQAGLDSITNNLLTTQGQLGSALTGTNARQLKGMSRLARRDSAKLDRIVNRGRSQVATRYGSAVAGTPNLFGDAQTVARTQGKVERGLVQQGKSLAGAGSEALAILSKAAETAASSGQYELAQALRSRTNDVEIAIAQNRADLAAARQDAEANERYLRLQNKLANGGTGGQGFQSAAGLVVELAQNGATAEDLQKNVDALALQYNLGAAQKAKLQAIADTYAGDSTSAVVSSPAAQAFTEANGISPSAALPEAARADLNKATWQAFSPSKPVPDTAEALRIAGIERTEVTDDAGNPTGKTGWTRNGVPLDEATVQAAIAYVQSTWMRAQAAADAAGGE
jgi:hypothetical protein